MLKKIMRPSIFTLSLAVCASFSAQLARSEDAPESVKAAAGVNFGEGFHSEKATQKNGVASMIVHKAQLALKPKKAQAVLTGKKPATHLQSSIPSPAMQKTADLGDTAQKQSPQGSCGADIRRGFKSGARDGAVAFGVAGSVVGAFVGSAGGLPGIAVGAIAGGAVGGIGGGIIVGTVSALTAGAFCAAHGASDDDYTIIPAEPVDSSRSPF